MFGDAAQDDYRNTSRGRGGHPLSNPSWLLFAILILFVVRVLRLECDSGFGRHDIIVQIEYKSRGAPRSRGGVSLTGIGLWSGPLGFDCLLMASLRLGALFRDS